MNGKGTNGGVKSVFAKGGFFLLYNMPLAREIGQKEALLLNHLYSLRSYYLKTKQLRDGKWFYIKHKDIQFFTGMWHQQQNIKLKMLEKLGLIRIHPNPKYKNKVMVSVNPKMVQRFLERSRKKFKREIEVRFPGWVFNEDWEETRKEAVRRLNPEEEGETKPDLVKESSLSSTEFDEAFENCYQRKKAEKCDYTECRYRDTGLICKPPEEPSQKKVVELSKHKKKSKITKPKKKSKITKPKKMIKRKPELRDDVAAREIEEAKKTADRIEEMLGLKN
jgi:hypothetical protein